MPTAPGVIGMRATIPTTAIDASTADGGSTSGPMPTHHRATSSTTNQASFAPMAAWNPSRPRLESIAFARIRRSSIRSTMRAGGFFRTNAQRCRAIRSSHPPKVRASRSDRTITRSSSAPAISTSRPSSANSSARWLDGIAGDEHADGGDGRQDEDGERLEQRREDDAGGRDVGRDVPLAVQDEAGGDVGRAGHRADHRAGGHVRADGARPGEPVHEDRDTGRR